MTNQTPTDRPAPAPSRRPRDLLLSLLVLVVPVLLLVGGYQVVAGRTGPVAVDPAPALASAEAAGVAVVTPEGLGEGWTPISAVFQEAGPGGTGGTVRIGYVTPDGGSVQLVQSTIPAEELLPAELSGAATPGGQLELAGQAWQQYLTADRDPALVRLQPEQTVLVVGEASETELRELAASLR